MIYKPSFVISILATMAVAIVSPVLAQENAETVAAKAPQRHLSGTFNDYVWVEANLGFGPWHVTGEWSARVNTHSGKGEFIGSLLGVRNDLWVWLTAADPADPALRSPHTHHVSLPDADVTVIPNGIRLEGTAIITVNGAVANYSGERVRVDVTGGNAIRYSNIKLTFLEEDGVDHFGPQPYDGLVVLER